MSLPAFDPWAELDKLRGRASPPPNPANPPNAPAPADAGLGALGGLGGGHPAARISAGAEAPQAPALDEVVAARAAWLAQAAADGFAALLAPDPDLDAERAIIASVRGSWADDR
ncbi:hypothetical protein GCM10011504_40520 [Siccirubricoccus deserti]|nr:hypothetical protein GCM10011504_40520 [Siccirubricoccus deserti]